jgi:hypothetical protein
MVFDMRMTIHLPDELLITARQRAAEKGMTLRAIIERSLRREIRQPRAGRRAGRRRIRWVTVPGGLPRGLDVSNRENMHAWLSGCR